MTDRGFVVIAVDPLGVGASSRPSDVDAVNLETMAAAAAEFVRQLRILMAVGELDSRLAPLEDVPLVAVGHSLGGCLAIVEQATSRQLRRRGEPRVHARRQGSDREWSGWAARPRMRRPRCRLPSTRPRRSSSTGWDAGYGLAPRALHHGWLHAADVPAEVIAADDEKASAWPRQSYVGALLAGHSATYAAAPDLPRPRRVRRPRRPGTAARRRRLLPRQPGRDPPRPRRERALPQLRRDAERALGPPGDLGRVPIAEAAERSGAVSRRPGARRRA